MKQLNIYIKEILYKLFADELLDANQIKQLCDKKYSEDTFDLDGPFLKIKDEYIKSSPEDANYWEDVFDGKYYAYKNWKESQRSNFDQWLDSLYSKIGTSSILKISVGYGWKEYSSAKADIYWQSLRRYLKKIKESVEKSLPNVRIEISRLRASHGDFVYSDIVRKIDDSDMLIFDVADVRTSDEEIDGDKTVKTYCNFNPNVMFELGMAIAIGKKPIVMCPASLKGKIPSDISNYMLTYYDLFKTKESMMYERSFEDRCGLTSLLVNRLRAMGKLK